MEEGKKVSEIINRVFLNAYFLLCSPVHIFSYYCCNPSVEASGFI